MLAFILDKRLRRGRLSVVDATNLVRDDRARWLGLARKHDVPPVAVVLDLPLEVCRRRDREREVRQVGDEVLERQHERLRRGREQLDGEGYHDVHVLTRPGQVAEVEVVRERGRDRD